MAETGPSAAGRPTSSAPKTPAVCQLLQAGPRELREQIGSGREARINGKHDDRPVQLLCHFQNLVGEALVPQLTKAKVYDDRGELPRSMASGQMHLGSAVVQELLNPRMLANELAGCRKCCAWHPNRMNVGWRRVLPMSSYAEHS